MGHSEFVDLAKPPGDRLKHYDRTRAPTDQPENDAVYSTDPARAVPQAFIDAMIVRDEVFVQEQHIPREHEVDDDDARSYHWVVYASIPAKAVPVPANGNGHDRKNSNSTKIPIGTIRLVPPPHPPHPTHAAGGEEDGFGGPPTNGADAKESYVQLGRLAVIPEFRKAGISKLLIETALAFAREHPYEVGPQLDPASMEALRKGVGGTFKGLVLVHAQTGVCKIWKKYGFELDPAMGSWDEEGIEHVGMWKRLDVTDGRRKSKIWLATNSSSP
jgi:predicted GNAT family N-acyltransferase